MRASRLLRWGWITVGADGDTRTVIELTVGGQIVEAGGPATPHGIGSSTLSINGDYVFTSVGDRFGAVP